MEITDSPDDPVPTIGEVLKDLNGFIEGMTETREEHSSLPMTTITVWVLFLSKPEHFVCGPYRSEEEAIRSGGGRIEDLSLPPDLLRVKEGLVKRLEGVKTTSLREQHRHWEPHLKLIKTTGERYTEEEMDERFPDVLDVSKRIPEWMKLTGL